jgi:uncharacterized protein YceK
MSLSSFFWLLPLLVLVSLSGCASVSTDAVQREGGGVQAPERIYVQDFHAPAAVFRVDRSKQGVDEFRAELAGTLTKANEVRTTKRLAPAAALERGAVLPEGRAWLVTGRFVRVNQGSRALRTALGFGLGGTKVETEVLVYDLSSGATRPFLRFRTTGGSGAAPGVVVGLAVPNMWLLSLDTLVHLGPGVSTDVIRTSRQIVAVLSEYMAQAGYIPPQKISRAKRLGEWP